ncbi:serine/threonine-protein phosphatase 6 regulatory ankyrin repeat subunit C isoform X2 [Diabrotica virgifera virgifera]|uniref:Serine/threonine-protein phosphatase 6 regulatory ankyrin repeat subunit C-like isoform X2 n=1 Tax=Diabrotica virgifera virgifera TaxID=50390 RepID=A0A6P7FD94_DIAVI|nr:serine/threonine-protein phosphatase 6 regulatory ankyrin repeat subunit C isoform X2 [Diabrotica virgifera virgifera]
MTSEVCENDPQNEVTISKRATKQFFQAVLECNLPIVTKFVEVGINVNLDIEDGNTSIHVAAEKCDIPILKVLLTAPNVNLNKKNRRGLTPLMLACIVNCRGAVQVLLQKDADPNILTHNGNRALHIACRNHNMGIVFDLVNNGAEINAPNVFDVTPLSVCVIDYPSMPIAKFLMRKGAFKQGCKRFPLLLEVALNCNTLDNLRIFKILVSSGMDIHQIHPIELRNCLHYVAISAYMPLVRFLLTFDIEDDLQVADASGRTPIDMALSHQNWKVFQLYRYYREYKDGPVRLRRATEAHVRWAPSEDRRESV